MLRLRVSLTDRNVAKAIKLAKVNNIEIKKFVKIVVFKAKAEKEKKAILSIMKIVEGYQLF